MDINLLVKLSSRAWSLPILAQIARGVACRQAPLIAATGAGRTAFGASLTHLIDLKLLERNPGHGHPLRPEFRLTPAGQAAAAMGALHNFDWRKKLPAWEEPTSLAAELARWADLLKHMQDPEWGSLARDLYDRLLARIPAQAQVGLIHGDFQPGNILYHKHEMSGVIDWDLAAIGPLGIDTGGNPLD